MTSDPAPSENVPYDEEIFSTPDLLAAQRIQLHAERLHVETSRVEDAVVVISKRVVTVRKQFEVDVSHEELVVERRPGDGSPIASGEPFARHVLLYAEQVELRKVVVPVEDVFVTTREVAEVRTVSGSVRREELVVTEASDDTAPQGERNGNAGRTPAG